MGRIQEMNYLTTAEFLIQGVVRKTCMNPDFIFYNNSELYKITEHILNTYNYLTELNFTLDITTSGPLDSFFHNWCFNAEAIYSQINLLEDYIVYGYCICKEIRRDVY